MALKDEFLGLIEHLEDVHDEVLDDEYTSVPVRDELLGLLDEAEESVREALRLFNES